MATQNSNSVQSDSTITAARTRPGAYLSTRETAQYIADMVLELRNLAKSSQLTAVQGLLEVTYYEAFGAANKVDVPAGETEFLNQLGLDAKRAMTSA